MIKGLSLAAMLAAAGTGQARAQDRTGDFDYYVLALTWSPSWCAAQGDPRDAQCDPDDGMGFSLHGLWPQHEAGGWPEYCDTDAADPGRRQTAAMADVMGSGDLAWYQWKKHGRCSGLEAGAYFAAARRVFAALTLPEPAGRVTAAALETAVLRGNPALGADGTIVTCRDGRLQEVRICLTRDMVPRSCGRDVQEDACRMRGSLEVPPAP